MTCIVPALDGAVIAYKPPLSGCCPPDLCDIALCDLECSFMGYLPSGPLWDRAKIEATHHEPITGCSDLCTETCETTLAKHAVYTARRLWDALMDALWPALRESSPYTAWDTREDWLRRLGWIDCFGTSCRDPALGDLTPLEVLGVKRCEVWSPAKQMAGDGFTEGAQYCPPTYPQPLIDAVMRGTILALSRLRLGIVPNVESINFIIKDLGAELLALPPDPDTSPPCYVVEPCKQMSGSDPCERRRINVKFKICPTGSTILIARKPECPKVTPMSPPAESTTGCSELRCETIPAFVDHQCANPPGPLVRVWPGVLAAECIARSIIPSNVNLTIVRDCG